MAPEVILSGQGRSPLFGPSGPKVKINNEGIRARKALVKFLVVFLFCSDFPNMLHVD